MKTISLEGEFFLLYLLFDVVTRPTIFALIVLRLAFHAFNCVIIEEKMINVCFFFLMLYDSFKMP